MPVLCICLKMRVPHQLIVLEDCDPVVLSLPQFFRVSSLACYWLVLLHGYCVGVEILEDDVVEERNLIVLVELNFDKSLAGLRCHEHSFVGD